MGKVSVTEKKRKRQELAAVEAIAKAAKLSLDEGLSTSEQGLQAEQELALLDVLPSVIVFDLDDTVWVGDVDMTSGPPFKTDGRGLPILAQKGGHGDKLVPFPDVPEVFDWIEQKGLKVVVSTHTYKPEWANEVLSLLETTQGTLYSDLLTIPLGKEVQKKTKDVHLKALAASLGCACSDMVFFDDKEGNVKDGTRVGVTSCITADGLSWANFVECLTRFAQKASGAAESPLATIAAAKASIPKAKAVVSTPSAPSWAARPFQWNGRTIQAASTTSNAPSWAARAPPTVASTQSKGGQAGCKWCAKGECWSHASSGKGNAAAAPWM
jgi:magnesium-dependent phosphatase 1